MGETNGSNAESPIAPATQPHASPVRDMTKSAGIAPTSHFHLPSAPALAKPNLPMPSLAAPELVKWNTQHLGWRMGVDAVSAGAAGALVAPLIAAIDKGIIENASGRRSLGESLRDSMREMVGRPGRFLTGKPLALVFVRFPGRF
jgi:hypothetical protein